MLNSDDIKQRGIILDADNKNFRAASYDLRIGRILAVDPANRNLVRETGCHVLEPQGMVEGISWETIRVPPDVAGYASVKTTMSRDGLLALNTGILDPGYEGLLSAAVVNFGKTEKPLNRGDVFLRLTFHPYQTPKDFEAPPPVPREEFVLKRKEGVSAYFSSSFLDMPGLVEEIAKNYFQRFFRQTVIAAGAVALVVAGTAFGVTLGVSYWQPYSMSKDIANRELSAYLRGESYQQRLAELERREHELEKMAAVLERRAFGSEAVQPNRRAGERK